MYFLFKQTLFGHNLPEPRVGNLWVNAHIIYNAEIFVCKPWRPKGFFNLKSL